MTNEKHLKKIAVELLSHSTHFELKSPRSLQHAIEALSLLSELEKVAQISLREAFLAAQTAMEKTLQKASEKTEIKTDSEKSNTLKQNTVTDPKLYTQWIEKIKPEYRDAFKNPALFQAFLKIQSHFTPAKTETRTVGRTTTTRATAARTTAPRTTVTQTPKKPQSSDFSQTAPPQMGATVEKPGTPLRRMPVGTHPVLRPKRSS